MNATKTIREISELVLGCNPYTNLETNGEPDLQGWGSQDEGFLEILTMLKPRRILELGSWKGFSAIHMAWVCQQHLGFTPDILCVDTWLGSVEFIGDTTGERDLQRDPTGWPGVYGTFLGNVKKCGFQENIFPFPNTTEIACDWLRKNGHRFDLAYVDSGHSFDEVSRDIRLASGISSRVMGDDADDHWPGVWNAIGRFEYTLHGHNKWLIGEVFK